MKREKLLITAVVGLLLLNMGMLAYLLMEKNSSRPGGPPQHRVDAIILNNLQFDAAQQEKFEELKHAHHTQMLALDAQSKEILGRYFKLLNDNQPDLLVKDSLEQKMAAIQREKAAVTFRHFADLKALCKPAQLAAFDRLLPALLQLMTEPNGKNFPPPRREE